MAKLVIADDADEEQMLAAYQSMTVLARLVWERPYDPKLAGAAAPRAVSDAAAVGPSDQLVPPAYGEAYRSYLPQAEWQCLPDCGHLGMFEKEAEFVEAVAQFAEG